MLHFVVLLKLGERGEALRDITYAHASGDVMPYSEICTLLSFRPLSVSVKGSPVHGHQDKDREDVEVVQVLNRVERVKEVKATESKGASIAIDMVKQQLTNQDNGIVVTFGGMVAELGTLMQEKGDMGDGISSQKAEFERFLGEEREFNTDSVESDGMAVFYGVERRKQCRSFVSENLTHPSPPPHH